MNPLPAASIFASSRFPFFTGTVMNYAPQGNSATTRTNTGVDSRTTTFRMSGNISLVSPNMIFSYQASPDQNGTITTYRANFGSNDVLNLTFLPEPARLALLASGVLGLFALYRMRLRLRLR